MDRWWIGALAAAVGSLGAGLGENLVRLSYSQQKFVELEESPPPLYKRPLWVVGWLMTTILTSTCAVVGLAFAPLQLVMPIGGLHILFGVAVAHVLNGEAMSPGDAGGAGLVCLGVMVVLLGVEKENPKVTFENFSTVLTRTESVVYFAVTVTAMLGLVVCRKKVGKGRVADLVRPVAAPALSGFLSAFANLMLKLSLSLYADPKWADISNKTPVYATLTLTILSGIGQVVTLNHALETSPAVVVVPTANSVLITVGSTAGLVFATGGVDLRNTVMLLMGILLVVGGIILLALREAAEDEEHHKGDLLPVTCNNTSFNSCDTNRSFAGYCGNISFNHHDNNHELKRTITHFLPSPAPSSLTPINLDALTTSPGPLDRPTSQLRTTSSTSTASHAETAKPGGIRVRSRFDNNNNNSNGGAGGPAHPPTLS